SSTTSGSACLMMLRTRASVSPRQSPSSLILASIRRDGESPPARSFAPLFFMVIVAFFVVVGACRLLASPVAPLGDVRQHEQVQTGEKKQNEREQRREAYPDNLFLLDQSDDVDDDGQRKGNGQPAVDLPDPRVPIH